MADLLELVTRIDTLLQPEEFDDYCVNGLQVEGRARVERLAVGVSVSQRFVDGALAAGADALLVHHGLFWRNTPHPLVLRAGPLRDRLKKILENDLSLIAYHLPLDAHPFVGNNAVIARELSLVDTEAVGLGVVGNTPAPEPTTDFIARLEAAVGQPVDPFLFGPDEVSRVGIASGGSGDDYPELLAAGCDTIVNGDRRENLVREYEEVGLNHLFAGHYATECFGPRALAAWCEEELGLEWEFVEVPNRV